MKIPSAFISAVFLGATTMVRAGSIVVAPGATITVNGTASADSVLGEAGSVISGVGVILNDTVVDGVLSPEPRAATFTTGSLTVNATGSIRSDLDGTLSTAGYDYDQIVVNGTVTLNGGTLQFTDRGFSASIGQSLLLIDNDGNDPISGTLAGVPEGGGIILPGPIAATVSYVAGDGNDLALILISDTSGQGTIVGLDGLSSLTGDGIIDRPELSAGVTLSGTVGGGNEGVTVTVTVGGLQTTTTASGGMWTITLDDGTSGLAEALDISGLVDGQIQVTADMTDGGGTVAPQVSDSFELNIVDTLEITSPIVGDDYLNAAELATGALITGTSEVEPGRIVTVTLEDVVGFRVEAPVVLQADGTWQLQVGEQDLVTDTVLIDETNTERLPQLATLQDGGWVMTWWVPGDGSDGLDTEVYLQRYAADGSAVGIPVKVDGSDNDNDDSVVITALDDGGWIVVWGTEGGLGDGTDREIALQRYDQNGNPVGGIVQVNESNATDDLRPSLAALPDGGWVVLWAGSGIGGDGTDLEIVAQRYAADGSLVGGNVKLDEADGSRPDSIPSIVILENGDWLASWRSWDGTAGNWDVYWQRFDSDGNARGGEESLNDDPGDAFGEGGIKVAALTGGGWVVTWLPNSVETLLYRQFDADGMKVAGGTVNSTGPLLDSLYSLMPLSDGGYLVNWRARDGEDDSDTFSQRYDANGLPVGGNVRLNQENAIYDGRPMTTQLPDGGWFAAWEAGTGLSGQRFTEGGVPIPDAVDISGLNNGPIAVLVEVTALDGSSYSDTSAFTLDTSPPVITLNGDAVVSLEVRTVWSDPGATVTDGLDLSVAVVTGGDTVDTNVAGTYTITYDASDAAGNPATQLSRTVTVLESFPFWAAQTGLTPGVNDGPLDDPDGDLIPNIQEFAFDDDPLSNAINRRVRTKLVSIPGAQILTLTLPVRTGAIFRGPDSKETFIDGISYEIQGTYDLENYDALVEETSPDPDAGMPVLSDGWEYRTFRVAEFSHLRNEAFLRVVISEVSP